MHCVKFVTQLLTCATFQTGDTDRFEQVLLIFTIIV